MIKLREVPKDGATTPASKDGKIRGDEVRVILRIFLGDGRS